MQGTHKTLVWYIFHTSDCLYWKKVQTGRGTVQLCQACFFPSRYRRVEAFKRAENCPLYVRVMKTETLFARRKKKKWIKNRKQKELFNLDFILTKMKEIPRYLKSRLFLLISFWYSTMIRCLQTQGCRHPWDANSSGTNLISGDQIHHRSLEMQCCYFATQWNI